MPHWPVAVYMPATALSVVTDNTLETGPVVVLADPVEVTVSPTSLSPWWQELRTLCTQSENVVAALVAAMVGKTVATEAMTKVRRGYIASM